MGPIEITAVAGIVVTVLTSLVVPYLLRRRQAARDGSATGVVSWQSITAVLQKERDDLRTQLDATEEECRERVRLLRIDYDQQLTFARDRIGHLEAEVEALYVRLGRRA